MLLIASVALFVSVVCAYGLGYVHGRHQRHAVQAPRVVGVAEHAARPGEPVRVRLLDDGARAADTLSSRARHGSR